MKHVLYVIIAMCMAISVSSCRHVDSAETSKNAVYYWKSWLYIGDAEKKFMAENNVNKLYLRFFDIRDDYRVGPVPDAEVNIEKSKFPAGTEFVPCVFITLEAIKDMKGREKEFAGKIFDRIDAKSKNGNLSFGEIQLDCDWTESTRDIFFKLCKELKALTSAEGKKLSSTIRLHQLSQPCPKVDKGVLMVYNVGNLKSSKETNSILRSDIVKNYLDKAPKYGIPLDVAYPVFSWGVVFNGTQFNRLSNINAHPDSIPELTRLHDNIYALQSNVSDDVNLDYRQTVRYEMASFDEIMKTKRLVEDYLGYKPQNTILYHLDKNQLSKYTKAQIKKIYE